MKAVKTVYKRKKYIQQNTKHHIVNRKVRDSKQLTVGQTAVSEKLNDRESFREREYSHQIYRKETYRETYKQRHTDKNKYQDVDARRLWQNPPVKYI